MSSVFSRNTTMSVRLASCHGRRHAGEIADGAHAGVQVEVLAHGHVERAHAAAHRRAQRTLDRDDEIAQRVQRLVGKPRAVELVGLLARVHLHPGDAAPVAVGLVHRGVHHLEHHRRHVDADAVALDEGDDRIVRDVQRRVRVDGDASGRLAGLDVFVLQLTLSDRSGN